VWKKDGKGEGKRGWGCGDRGGGRGGKGKGDGQKGEEKREKGASASAFLAFFYLCLPGRGWGLNQEPIFFPLMKPFLYTCFSGRAVLVVFETSRAGAFDRVTGRQRDRTGRGGSGREERYFREPAGLVVRSRPRVKALSHCTIILLYS